MRSPLTQGDGVVDLSQPLERDMPAVQPHGRPDFEPVVHELNGWPFTIGRISMSAHTGTHLDAPRHALREGKTLDEYPVERFMGEGVALDLRREGPVAVTAGELASAKPEIRPGDIALLWFGYADRFGSDAYRLSHPYLSDDAAQFLVDRRVPMVGLDLQTPDRPASQRGPQFGFPAHRILLGADCLIVENLGPGLAALAGHRLQVVAVPLPLPGADGSPVRPLAWRTLDS
jgi:kynurenine formamidase